MVQITLAEFEVGYLRVLERVRLTGEAVAIVKDGEPLAVVTPPPPSRKAAYGALKHTLEGPVGDPVSPLDDVDWEVLRP